MINKFDVKLSDKDRNRPDLAEIVSPFVYVD